MHCFMANLELSTRFYNRVVPPVCTNLWRRIQRRKRKGRLESKFGALRC